MSRIAFARFLSKYLYFSPKGSKISLSEVSGWVLDISIRAVEYGIDVIISVQEIHTNHGLTSDAHYHYFEISMSDIQVVDKDRITIRKHCPQP